MKNKIIGIIKEILEGKDQKIDFEINEESILRDLGLSSFDLAQLTVEIEDEFDIDIFEDGIVQSVGEIIKIIEEKS